MVQMWTLVSGSGAESPSTLETEDLGEGAGAYDAGGGERVLRLVADRCAVHHEADSPEPTRVSSRYSSATTNLVLPVPVAMASRGARRSSSASAASKFLRPQRPMAARFTVRPQALTREKTRPERRDQYDLMLVDECHDTLGFKVESFNRRLVAAECTRVVCERLAEHIDPADPGKTWSSRRRTRMPTWSSARARRRDGGAPRAAGRSADPQGDRQH